MKRCSGCKQEKPLDEFGNDIHTQDGKRIYCKSCSRIHRLAQRENRERWKVENKEQYDELRKAWVKRNPEKRKATVRKYKDTHREEYLAKKREYYQRHKAQYAEYDRQSKERNPFARLADKSRYRARLNGCEIVPYNREDVYIRDNGRCVYCGKETKAVDHVMPLSRGGADCIENVVLCCHSCNVSKGKKTLMEWIESKSNRC